eukprot:14592993-Alexandrium_andersonii.AAC.1
MGSHTSSSFRTSLRHRRAFAGQARGDEGRPFGSRRGSGPAAVQGGPLADRHWLRARPSVPRACQSDEK